MVNKMRKTAALTCIAIFIFLASLPLAAQTERKRQSLTDADIDLFCLKLAYPQVKKVHAKDTLSPLLELDTGERLPYIQSTQLYNSPLAVDLKSSMAQPYPLDPDRPPTPRGFSPGRKRPYYFFEAIYGRDKGSVQKQLKTRNFLSGSLTLNRNAANAFENARSQLLLLAGKEKFAPYLRPDGAYYWRKIAGENVPSAHSWGIAIDLGVKNSPYWRWSKERPHPKQQSYPRELVETMESHGYIWGGKWHEYDIMHFEYRPELICKARMLDALRRGNSHKFPAIRLPASRRGK